MKIIIQILSIILLFCVPLSWVEAELQTSPDPFENMGDGLFPDKEIPSVSMITALKYFQDYAKKNNTIFSPRSSYVAKGGIIQGEGIWIFTSVNTKGQRIKYMYYFPKDVCIIVNLDDPADEPVAFKKDGTPIK